MLLSGRARGHSSACYGTTTAPYLPTSLTNVELIGIPRTFLRPCYAMSKTTGRGPLSAGMCLRARYAMSGTEMADRGICLCSRYAMSGTNMAYRGTRLDACAARGGGGA
eukprot:208566-Rhodomonas_salina.1